MTRRQAVWTALATAHLILVAVCAFSLPLPESSDPVSMAVRWYGSISGANNSYGFFKQVGCGIRAKFFIIDADGVAREETLSRGENHEVELRFSASVNMIGVYGDPLMQHWAAAMFGRHPEAQVVVIRVEQFDPGTMADFREGKIPEWTKMFDKVFTRQELVTQPEETQP